MESKIRVQEHMYKFPYHYIPELMKDGSISNVRTLSWGMNYLGYLLFVKKYIDDLSPKNLLDVGCGDGRFVSMLDSSIEVTGVDKSRRAIQFAKAFVPEQTFLSKDVSTITGTFQAVTMIEVLEHIPEEKVKKFMLKTSERVAPEGNLILTVPSKVRPVNPKHFRHYDKQSLQAHLNYLGPNFHVKKISYILRDPIWYQLFRKFTANPIWKIEIKFLTRWLWRIYRSGCMVETTSDKGIKLIALVERTS